MTRQRLAVAVWVLAYLAGSGCKVTPGPGVDTSSPDGMSANPRSVSVEVGKSADVTIGFQNALGDPLDAAHWLPLCSLSSDKPDVATATIVGTKVHVTGLAHGTATITVSSSAHVDVKITVEVTSPTPVITSVFPNLINKGADVTLTITATGLQPGAKVQINGAEHAVTALSATQLQVTLTMNETFVMEGSIQLGIFNPPDGALSDLASLPVLYPEAVIDQIFPTSAPAGSPDGEINLTMSLADGNFRVFPTSKVRWDGADLVTTYLGHFELKALVQANRLLFPGTHQITVFNPAPGGGESGAKTFTVTGPAAVATFDFTNYEPQVVWAAQAQGGGVFSPVPVVAKVATFPVTADKVTFAFVSAVGIFAPPSFAMRGASAALTTYQLNVFSMTKDEMTSGVQQMGFPFGTTAISGTVSGVGAGEVAQLLWGNGAAVTNPALTTFAINNSTAGPHSLVGYKRNVAGIAPTDRVFMRIGQPPASGVGIDFHGAESAQVESATATLTGLIGGDQAFGIMGYTTEPTCEGTTFYQTPASASFPITGVPAAVQGPNDVHIFTFIILNGPTTLQQTFNSRTLQAFTAARPVPLATPTVTDVAGAPYLIKQAVVNLGDYSAGYLFYSNVQAMATKGFLGGATGTISVPDLSGTAGWLPAYGPQATAAWAVSATTSIAPIAGCGNGTTRTTVSVSGSN